MVRRTRGCTAEAALEGFSRQMKRLPAVLRRRVTYDRGSEMACHPELARRLKIDIRFCDPHAPWHRGSNENTNGLRRQFFPKGTDQSIISQTGLNDVARLMNRRPRRTLGWKTPEEAMAEERATFRSTVALETRIQALPQILQASEARVPYGLLHLAHPLSQQEVSVFERCLAGCYIEKSRSTAVFARTRCAKLPAKALCRQEWIH